MDWYSETFGACPHGGVKPYCPQCAGDRLAEKRAERDRKKRESLGRVRAERRAKALSVVVDNQSAALDAADRKIRALQNEVNRSRAGRVRSWLTGR